MNIGLHHQNNESANILYIDNHVKLVGWPEIFVTHTLLPWDSDNNGQ
ncbi:MAG: hypothetical protein ACYTFY_14450 [Planctomycetota bacterium]|jgi:prepilin-type processing-associated H-X9-DG protein